MDHQAAASCPSVIFLNSQSAWQAFHWALPAREPQSGGLASLLWNKHSGDISAQHLTYPTFPTLSNLPIRNVFAQTASPSRMHFLYTSDANILSHLKCSVQMLPSPRTCFWFPPSPLIFSDENTCSGFLFLDFFVVPCNVHFCPSTNYRQYLCKYLHIPV